MNVAKAFSFGTSGIINDHQIQSFSNMVNANFSQVQGLGGWLGETANKYLDDFNHFVNSRVWEMSSRLKGKHRQLGYFDIGVIDTLDGLQNAQGFMRDYIMGMPGVMESYLDKNLSGWGGDFSEWCTGTGEDNIYYRRQMNGVLDVRVEDDLNKAYLKHYHDSVAGQGCSVRERMDLAQTRRTVNHYLAKDLFDFTSSDNAYTAHGQALMDAEAKNQKPSN